VKKKARGRARKQSVGGALDFATSLAGHARAARTARLGGVDQDKGGLAWASTEKCILGGLKKNKKILKLRRDAWGE